MVTSEGHDYTFTTNYLGHFLLTVTILDNMKDVKNIRVINILSDAVAETRLSLDDLMNGKGKFDKYKVCVSGARTFPGIFFLQ